MKKFICSFLIVSLILSGYREAHAVAVPVAAVAVGAAVILTAAGVSYYSNPSASAAVSAAVSAAGNYYRTVDAYTEGITAYGKAQLYKDVATLGVAGQALIDTVKNAADGMYTALKDLLAPSSVPTGDIPNNTFMTLSSGQSIEILFYLRDQMLYLPRANPYVVYVGPGYGDIYFPSGAPYQGDQGILQNYKVYRFQNTAYNPAYPAAGEPTTADPVTPSQLPSLLAPDGTVPADIQAEIDDLIRLNPSIASPSSAGSATAAATLENSGSQVPPFVPVLPDGVTTTPPDNITGLGAQTLADAQARLAAAQQALEAAQAAAAADPTSLPLQQAVTTAQTEVANATQTVIEAGDNAAESYQTPQKPPRKTFDWSKLKLLGRQLANTYPFYFLLLVPDIVGQLVREPKAPVFTLPIYQDQVVTIDLSFFDSVALLFRWVLALLLTVGAIQKIVNFYRGTS